MKSILSAVVGATLALSAIEADAQATPGERQVSLTIESTSLATALDKWAQQSGFQIFVQDWEGAKNLPARSLKGTFTAQDALEQLLAGTSLTYVWISDKAVSIRKKTAQTVPTALQRMGLDGQQAIPVAKFSGDDVGGVAPYLPAGSGSAKGSDAGVKVDELEEIIVTGTYIRGGAPTGSPLRIYSRAEMDRSGAATIEQFARQMTENFSATDSSTNTRSSATKYVNNGYQNVFGGAAFDLHGIGPSSTLTLLNGNRLASAGFGGDISDVSQIPLSIVERVEVMTDGASAIYGADAVAGVVNIITRDDFDGAETRVRFGASNDGGAEEFVASQLLGASWEGGSALLNYEFNRQEELDASERDYLPDQGGPFTLIPTNRRNSFFVAGKQDIGERTQVSVNAMYGERDTDGAYHHSSDFQESGSTYSADVRQSGVALALEHRFVGDWVAHVNGNYSRLRQQIVDRTASEFFDATIEQLADSDVLGADLLLSGDLANLWAGELKGAVGLSTREEQFGSFTSTALEFGGFTSSASARVPDVERRVDSVYGEVLLPLVGGGQSSTQSKLDLSGAIRHDRYSDFGSTTNFKIGLAWVPADGFHLRGTYGTSFRAPPLSDLHATVESLVAPHFDPESPSGVTNVLSLGGGNADLGREKSKSFTAGFDVRPAMVPGVLLSVTYFDIDFEDRAAFPIVTGDIFTDPLASPFIIRNPPLEVVQAYFDSPGFLGDQGLGGLGAAGVGAIFDGRRANIASTKQSGVDLNAVYELSTAHGDFTFNLSAERLLHNDYRVVEQAPDIEFLNTFAQPPKLKGRAGVAWARGGLQMSLAWNYINSYRNGLGTRIGVPPSVQTIDSWSTADLYLAYATDRAADWLNDVTLALSVTNLTDEEPPFVDIPAAITLPNENVLPFDAANASALGRFVALQITKRW